MPILATINDLKPGMRLSSNIVNKFNVLLPANHELTESDISTLARLVPDKSIYIVDPSLDDIVDFDDVSHAQTVARVIQEKSSTVIDKVCSIFRSGQSLSGSNMAEMDKVIRESVKYLVDNPVTMALVQQSKNWEKYLQDHSSKVFYLSLVIGNKIRTYIKNERIRISSARFISNPTELTPLGTAALFHDIAMVKISHLYQKNELDDIEKKMLMQHPHTGAQMLPESISPVIRTSIREHHENHMGTGYPEGLPGEAIHVFARIIRIADAYCFATADRVGYKGKLEALVLYEMLYGNCKKFYDPEILAVFGSIVPSFPIGAKLKLQDGRDAVVVRHNNKSPFQPELIIAFDEFGKQLPREKLEPTFNLGDRSDARILSFAGEDFSFLNETVYNLHPEDKYDKVLGFSFP